MKKLIPIFLLFAACGPSKYLPCPGSVTKAGDTVIEWMNVSFRPKGFVFCQKALSVRANGYCIQHLQCDGRPFKAPFIVGWCQGKDEINCFFKRKEGKAMSTLTTEDMNEAIAIFDGWEFKAGDPKHKCPYCIGGDEPCTPAVDRFIKDGRTVFHYELKYNTSWDALMPVGKKIYDSLAVMMRKRRAHTTCHGDVLEVDIQCHIREYNITGAHRAIFEFIQWYNKTLNQ